jgi:hypothetical protein
VYFLSRLTVEIRLESWKYAAMSFAFDDCFNFRQQQVDVPQAGEKDILLRVSQHARVVPYAMPHLKRLPVLR